MKPRFHPKYLIILPPLGWLFFFFLLPLLIILFYSFCMSKGYGGVKYQWSLQAYQQVFDPDYLAPLGRTFFLAFKTTLACLFLGYPLAYFIATRKRSKNFWLVLVILPFWTSFLIRVYAWTSLLLSQGLINKSLQRLYLIQKPLDLLFTETAVFLGLLYGQLPFMVLPLYTSLEKVDKNLLDASSDLGASPWKSFWYVLLPLTKPGIWAGSILVFSLSFGDYITVDLLGGSKTLLLGKIIQNQFQSAGNWPFGSALSLILILGIMIILNFYLKAQRSMENGGSPA